MYISSWSGHSRRLLKFVDVFCLFQSDFFYEVSVNKHVWARENELRERIPHTWPSSHENYFQSILGSVSYCVVILRAPPYWSVRVVSCNFKLGGSRVADEEQNGPGLWEPVRRGKRFRLGENCLLRSSLHQYINNQHPIVKNDNCLFRRHSLTPASCVTVVWIQPWTRNEKTGSKWVRTWMFRRQTFEWLHPFCAQLANVAINLEDFSQACRHSQAILEPELKENITSQGNTASISRLVRSDLSLLSLLWVCQLPGSARPLSTGSTIAVTIYTMSSQRQSLEFRAIRCSSQSSSPLERTSTLAINTKRQNFDFKPVGSVTWQRSGTVEKRTKAQKKHSVLILKST